MAGPSKRACVLFYLACAQDDVQEQFAEIDSEEELEGTTPQDSSTAEENDLEWHHQFPFENKVG
jgi:hypothetical protein